MDSQKTGGGPLVEVNWQLTLVHPSDPLQSPDHAAKRTWS